MTQSLSNQGESFRYPRLFELFVVCFGPACFYFSGQFQLFPIPGWVDAGIYLGYLLDFPTLVEKYGITANAYHGTRLAYVLPGFTLHKVFAPEVAQVIFSLAQLALAAVGAWVIGFRFGGRAGALLTAISITYNPQILAAVTVGGVDGVAVAYSLLAGACLFVRPGDVSRWQALAFGAAAALSASSQPFGAVACCALALAKLLGDLETRKNIRVFVVYGLVGGCLTVTTLGLVGMWFGLRFLYFLESAQMVRQAVKGIGANYREPLLQWLPGAYRIVVPIGILVTGFAACFLGNQPQRKPLLGATTGLLAMAVFFCTYDWLVQGVTLQFRVYTNLVIPLTTLVFAAWFGLMVRDTKHVNVYLIWPWAVLPAAIAVIATWFGVEFWQSMALQWLVFACLCFAFVYFAHYGTRLQTTGASTQLGAGWTLVVLVGGAFNVDSVRIYQAYSGFSYRDLFNVGIQFKQQVAPVFAGNNRMMFAYNRNTFSTGDQLRDSRISYNLRYADKAYQFGVYDTMSGLFVYDRTMLTASAPQVDAATLTSMLPNKNIPATLVVLGQSHTEALAVVENLRANLGLNMVETKRAEVKSGAIAFKLWFYEYDPLQRALPAMVAGCQIQPDTTCPYVLLNGASLAGAQLSRAKLPNAQLVGANLAGAQLGGANFAGASLQGASLLQAELGGTNFASANLTRSDLGGASLPSANFSFASFSQASFIGSNLAAASLFNVTANATDFSSASMQKTQLQNSQFVRANFSGAQLKGANFSGSALQGADFTGADLRDVVFTKANLNGATFNGAQTQGCVDCPASVN